MIKHLVAFLIVIHPLAAGTFGTIYRSDANHVPYTSANLPLISAPSSAVYCSDCLRDVTCSAGVPNDPLVGAMAFTALGTGDWVCDTGTASVVPDSMVLAIEGRVCIDPKRDQETCLPGQIARTDGSAFLSFWEYWGRRIVNTSIEVMRIAVCDENVVRFGNTGRNTCASGDEADVASRKAAEDSFKSRTLPID